MSDIINEFEILRKLSEDFKQNIQSFYIFGDYNRTNENWTENRNVLIVTKKNEVFAFGENKNGELGLGHNSFVSEPTIVNELCDKNIAEFKSGWTHCMARTYFGNVFTFGMNFCG